MGGIPALWLLGDGDAWVWARDLVSPAMWREGADVILEGLARDLVEEAAAGGHELVDGPLAQWVERVPAGEFQHEAYLVALGGYCRPATPAGPRVEPVLWAGPPRT